MAGECGAGLVQGVLGVRLDKAQQRSAWGQRPLSSAQVMYAAMDAQVLLQLAERLAHCHRAALPPNKVASHPLPYTETVVCGGGELLPASWVQPLHCHARTTADVCAALEAAGVQGWSLEQHSPEGPDQTSTRRVAKTIALLVTPQKVRRCYAREIFRRCLGVCAG
jgi:hypothetical protein